MAADNININNKINTGRIYQNQSANKIIGSQNANASANTNGKSFSEILKEAASNDLKLRQQSLNINIQTKPQELTFSKHAKQRLAQRNIDIDGGLIEKISGALKKASEKSIKNALVLSEESAFIISVDNSVVVTAMNSLEMRESVITNIDGTVIL